MKSLKTISIFLLLAIAITALIPFNSYGLEKDYIGHWAEGTIQTWLDNNYVTGYSDGSFKPDGSITRAEFVTMANKLLDFIELTDIFFTDVNPDDWYYQEVQKAYKAGYISGVSETLFSPNSNLTREQAAVIITKIMGLDINIENILNFSDNDLISHWALEYVNAAAAAEIILGYTADNTFRPQNPITRAEAVVLLDRLNQFIIEDTEVPEGTITPPPVVDVGGGPGPGPGPVDPAPKAVDLTVNNQVIILGIDDEFNLAENITLGTPEVTITYITDNKGAIDDPLNGNIKGKAQGKVNVTVKATKEGHENKEVKFQIIVAPVSLSWTDPSGTKMVGEEQDILINIGLLEGVNSVENVAISMIWEKLIDSTWITVDGEDITIIYDSAEVTMKEGIYQLIKRLTVDKSSSIKVTVSFNNVGEYKLTVYGIME